jgi:hypothetical protein
MHIFISQNAIKFIKYKSIIFEYLFIICIFHFCKNWKQKDSNSSEISRHEILFHEVLKFLTFKQ